MSQQFYQKLLKLGVILSFVSFFIVDKDLYFPFITGKQLYFNILMEALAVVWVAYLVKFPEARPKKSWISWGLVAFYSALLLSSIFGIDFNLSFWGDAERMLGWFQIIHLFIMYLIIISVFKTESDWLMLFVASLCSAVGLALYAFFTAQGMKAVGNVNMTSNISTLGNATYVAGVMIFNFFFAWYLFFKSKDWTMRFVIAIVLLAVVKAFFYADVSGSQAGWGIGIMVMLGIAGLLSHERRVRRWTWAGLAVFVISVILLFSFRSAPIFDNNKVGKILRDFNADNTTFRTRTYAWRAAWLGFLEHPVLGNGYGNFADTFDRHFKGSFYNWTIYEEYYDRAHNNLLDILSTGGLVSLLAYLAIFVAIGYYLIKGARLGRISTLEASTMAGVFVSYFIHNLAVFDALANYILLFISLAFVYYLSNRHQGESTPAKSVSVATKHQVSDTDVSQPSWTRSEKRAWIIGALVAGFLIYNYNLSTWKVFEASVNAASAWANVSNPQVTLDLYHEAMSINSPLIRDTRMLWSTNIIQNPAKINELDPLKRIEAIDYAASLIKDNLKYNSNDSLTWTNLARLQVTAFRLTSQPKYLDEALKSIDEAIANGGEHIPPYILKANIQMGMGQNDAAKATLLKAKSFFDKYADIDCYLAKIDLTTNQENEATYKMIDVCLETTRGQQLVGIGNYLPKLEKYYSTHKDYLRLAKVYELQLAMDRQNEKLWDKLYQAYVSAGDDRKAEATIEARKEVLSGKAVPGGE